MSWEIIEGDALEEMERLPALSFDAVVTDPPYILAAGSTAHQRGKVGSWADMMNASAWFESWFRLCWGRLKPSGCMWVFTSWRSLAVLKRAYFRAGIPTDSLLVWDKCWIGPGGSRGLRPSYELAVLSGKPDFRIADRSLPDIWRVKWSSQKPNGHPAEKPEKLYSKILRESGVGPGSRVLDPFAGSGSCGVAALGLGAEYVGVEAEPHWCDVARTRLAAAAGQATLFGGAA